MANVNEELASFCKFAEFRLHGGDAADSLDSLYAEWRASNPSPELLEIDVRAVRAALRDMEAGQIGRPVDEFLAEFRQRNGI